MARSVKKQLADDDALTPLINQFNDYADNTITMRQNALKARQYKDGVQWTEEERKTLAKRKQPCITDNKIQDKVDTLMGLEKQNRTDPRAYPRTDHETEAAEVATDALRFVADSCDYHRATRKPAADNLIVEGLCAGQVIVEKRKGSYPKVCMEHIRWDRVYWDIQSLRDDFSDKTYCGYFTWMDYESALQKWKDKKTELNACFSQESISGSDITLDDKPRFSVTTSGRKRVQVFKHYRIKGGVWNESTWVKGGWLEEEKPCAYLDENGEPACCMELQALYRDSDGKPYGAVQRYIDLQDEHNKRRSKMLHLLNAKRVIVSKGLVDDITAVRAEVHKPDGVVEVAGDITQFRVEDNIAESQGQWQLLQQTDAALAATGPNAALAGQSGDLSGRAKQLDQAAGSIAVSPLFDALEAWECRMYRQVWYRIKQYWNSEIWIRVTDDENKYKFVVVNQPLTQGDLMAQQLANEPIPPEQKAQLVQQMASDPQMQQPAIVNGKPVIKNRVAEIDVDIVIDRSPDTINLQQEQFSILAELAKARPEVPFKSLIKASQLRSEIKKEITDELQKQPQIPPQIQEQMQQQQEALARGAQDLQAREQAIAQAEAALTQQANEVKGEATNLDLKRAEIRVDMEKIKVMFAELDAKQAELAAQEKSINDSAQIASERLDMKEESLRTTLKQEAQNMDAQAVQRERDSSSSVLDQVAKIVEAQDSKIERALMSMQNQLLQALSQRSGARRINIERGPDGKSAALIEE